MMQVAQFGFEQRLRGVRQDARFPRIIFIRHDGVEQRLRLDTGSA
jgi:hypothetical protein